MIRDIPPLAVEGVDPWEKVQIDPVTRRLAEHAAAAAGLAVEEWLERAIRRSCPSAFRTASVTIPSTPIITPTFAAPPAPPRPVMPPPGPVATPAQPPEIEASLAALLAMAQRQQQPAPAPAAAPIEARYAPVEPPPAPLPPIAPIIRQTAIRPAPVATAPVPPPPAPVAERPAATRRPLTIAERLAQQRFDEPEEEQAASSFRHEDEAHAERDLQDRDWQDDDDRADTQHLLDEQDDEGRDGEPEPKKKFKLWATRDEYDFAEPQAEPRQTATVRTRRIPLARAPSASPSSPLRSRWRSRPAP